ncbi:TPA: hypothetical protein EYN98_14495 [Candidatus Poribacteria bacterium]|nr:hypothetical protein [Candidatus Poribacteria bacterium]
MGMFNNNGWRQRLGKIEETKYRLERTEECLEDSIYWQIRFEVLSLHEVLDKLNSNLAFYSAAIWFLNLEATAGIYPTDKIYVQYAFLFIRQETISVGNCGVLSSRDIGFEALEGTPIHLAKGQNLN